MPPLATQSERSVHIIFVKCEKENLPYANLQPTNGHRSLRIEKENTAIQKEMDILTQHRLSFVIQRRYVHSAVCEWTR